MTIEPLAESRCGSMAGSSCSGRDIFGYMDDPAKTSWSSLPPPDRRWSLFAYTYEGFWSAMDTFKDKEHWSSCTRAATRPGRSGHDRRAEG